MTPKQYDRQHLRHLSAMDRCIDQLFDKALKRLASYGIFLDKPLGDQPFSFSDYPEVQQVIDGIFEEFRQSVEVTITEGLAWEDNLSASKATDLASRYGVAVAQQRSQAVAGFAQRKVGGLDLSQRVWNITSTFEKEVETAMDIALRDGTPANRLATDLKQYLKHPDKLFRRVRDEHGQLQLSKRAKEFHPGAGVYRSSYKNARRLAVTETNMAYHKADNERWRQLDFVLGYEVQVSGTNPNVCPLCVELAGKYPKEFEFVGWHPHCRCHAVPIMEDVDSFQARQDALLRGERIPATGQVTEPPKNFTDHLANNSDRIQRASKAGTLPYFVRDNARTVDKVLGTNIEEGLLLKDAKHIAIKAREVGSEVQSLAENIATRYGATCTPINYKSVGSIVRKVNTERNDMSSYAVAKLKDTVRTTIIADRKSIDGIIYDLSDNYKVRALGDDAVKIQTADKYMGYTGTIVNLKTSSGLVGEIQVNTPKMIYAKEPPEIAQALLGKPLWNKIYRETGVKGGLGHKLYEELRTLPIGTPKYEELKRKSIEYYAHFQD